MTRSRAARVPKMTMRFRRIADGTSLRDRVGGLPNAPSRRARWPVSAGSGMPMEFMFQICGRAAGGAVDLGPVTLLQVFANMEGSYYEEGESCVVLRRKPCDAVLDAPDGITITEARLAIVRG